MEEDKIRQKARKLINEKYPHLPFKEWGYFEDMFINGWKEALTIPVVSDMLCGSFDADNSTSSATKCKCGREKWEHPKPRN
jgi:hypothetical protein